MIAAYTPHNSGRYNRHCGWIDIEDRQGNKICFVCYNSEIDRGSAVDRAEWIAAALSACHGMPLDKLKALARLEDK